MTNKTKTFSLLLAGTFLSSPAVAADTLNFGADNLNQSALPQLKWSETSFGENNEYRGSTTINLPDGEKTLYYQYTKPSDYSLVTTRPAGYYYNIDSNTLYQGITGDGGQGMLGSIGRDTKSDFINNTSNNLNGNAGYYSTYGGAVAASDSTVSGVFINNRFNDEYTSSNYDFVSGVVSGGGAIGIFNPSGGLNISGQFINNSVVADNIPSLGGAISAIEISSNANGMKISGNFVGNYVQSANRSAAGGAIALLKSGYEHSQISIAIADSNFINNHVKSNYAGFGGAIYAEDVTPHIYAENSDVYFIGNYIDNNGTITPNDIYQYNSYVALIPTEKHGIYLDGGIDGSNYYIEVGPGTTNSGTGTVYMANGINNAEYIYITPGTTLKFVKGARGQGEIVGNTDLENYGGTFDLNNGYIETVKLSGYSSSGGRLVLDVDPENNISDKLEISGDVSGTTDVVVYTLSSALPSRSIVFATAQSGGDADSFKLASDSAQVVVYANPIDYRYDVQYNQAEDGSREWYFAAAPEPEDPENPDEPVVTPPEDNKPSKPLAYRAEVIAGAGLHEAAIEQTRSVVRNVRTKVADGRLYCPGCGIYDYGWNNQQLRNVWVNVQGETATIDKPAKMDADIWGVEAGFDVQNDIHNTLGVFASYRKGEYDLSGKADKLRSNIGSEIDIDSYLAGLYYRYDKNMNWLFATVYGGVQQADAKTDDKIAKFDTDGIEFGAGVEAGHTFALSNDLTLDPSLGLYYTQINFDDAKDNVGKEYDWKDIKHLEAELGAKLEKQIDYAKIYVKPSIIQTITSGDSVKITGLNKLSTYDDATLGRIELGGRYGFTDALSAYGWVNYTFGSGYDATAFGAGVSYSW